MEGGYNNQISEQNESIEDKGFYDKNNGGMTGPGFEGQIVDGGMAQFDEEEEKMQ